MKKIIIGLMTMSSISAFAQSEYDNLISRFHNARNTTLVSDFNPTFSAIEDGFYYKATEGCNFLSKFKEESFKSHLFLTKKSINNQYSISLTPYNYDSAESASFQDYLLNVAYDSNIKRNKVYSTRYENILSRSWLDELYELYPAIWLQKQLGVDKAFNAFEIFFKKDEKSLLGLVKVSQEVYGVFSCDFIEKENFKFWGTFSGATTPVGRHGWLRGIDPYDSSVAACGISKGEIKKKLLDFCNTLPSKTDPGHKKSRKSKCKESAHNNWIRYLPFQPFAYRNLCERDR